MSDDQQPVISSPDPHTGPETEKVSFPQDPGQQKQGFLDKLSTRKGITILITAIVVFLIIAAVTGIVVYNKYFKPTPTAPPLTNFELPPSLEELAEKYPDYADILLDPALDSAYKDFLIAYQEGGVDGAIELARARGMINTKGELMVTLEFDVDDTTAVQEQLKGEGISINTAHGNLLDIGIPVDLIKERLESDDPAAIFEELTELEHVTRVRLPKISTPDSSLNLNDQAPVYQMALESLPVINATAWHEAGFTGQGMRIGILDFGFDQYQDELGNELPDSSMVTARSFIAGAEIDQTGINHGTAVAEVIHAIAPDAYLVFAAYSTDTEFYEAIDWLVSQNVSIINHSGGGAFGPRNGTGSDVQAIDRVVSNNIMWVNSSGNSGSRHWRGKFTDTNGDGVHEFLSDGTYGMVFYPFYNTGLLVQWDDWDAMDQDLDVYVVDSTGEILYSSYITQDGSSGNPPFEGVFYEFPDYGPYYLVIYGTNVTRDITIDVFANYADFEPAFIVPEYSLLSPSDAQSSFTICATNWESGNLTDYSSQGPTVDGRLKPDMCGPTETYSVAFGDEFAGTSNSSPQVAGAAALIRQAFPEFSVDQVKAFLLDRAEDRGPAGPDPQYGKGLLWMGDPPGKEVVITAPPEEEPDAPTETPIVVAIEPEPTEEEEGEGGEVEDEEEIKPIDTVSGMDNTWKVIAGLFCCFSLLVVFGIILLVVLLSRRKKPRRPMPPMRPAAPYRPPAPQPVRPVTPQPVPPHPPAPAPQQQVPPAAVCPHCGAPRTSSGKFCARCGGLLEVPPAPPAQTVCHHCGEPLRPGAAFCPKCGQKQ
jgi:subtilisin family serine protease